jgi:protein-disulfide isomerase
MQAETRRRVLLLSGAAALVAAFQLGPRLLPARLEFAPVPGLPGFRRLDGGAATLPSAGDVLFLGLDAPQVASHPPPGTQQGLCRALFGPAAAAPVPVAFFTDPYCPNCRALEARLGQLGDGVAVQVHHVPVLGPASTAAAQALLAAGAMGLGPVLSQRLARARVVPDAAFLRRFAEGEGADGSALVAALDAPAVRERLAASRGLYDAFGFVGTPGLVMGRTAVNGDLPTARLRALAERERQEPPVCA